MARSSTFHVPCPLCRMRLTLTVRPRIPATRSDPPEGPEIESIGGCPCVDGDLSDQYADDLFRLVEEEYEAAYDAEMDRRIRTQLDGEA